MLVAAVLAVAAAASVGCPPLSFLPQVQTNSLSLRRSLLSLSFLLALSLSFSRSRRCFRVHNHWTKHPETDWKSKEKGVCAASSTLHKQQNGSQSNNDRNSSRYNNSSSKSKENTVTLKLAATTTATATTAEASIDTTTTAAVHIACVRREKAKVTFATLSLFPVTHTTPARPAKTEKGVWFRWLQLLLLWFQERVCVIEREEEEERETFL